MVRWAFLLLLSACAWATTNTVTVTVAGNDTGNNLVYSNRAGVTTPDINYPTCASPCVGTVTTGATVWLFATPSATSAPPVFSGDCTSTWYCKLTVGANKAVTVTFTTNKDIYGGLLSPAVACTAPSVLTTITQTVTGSTTAQSVTVGSNTNIYATAAARSAPSSTAHTVLAVNLGQSDAEIITVTATGAGTITAVIPSNHSSGATLSPGEWRVGRCGADTNHWVHITPLNHPEVSMGEDNATYNDRHNDNQSQDYCGSVSGAANTGTPSGGTGVACPANGSGTGKYGANYQQKWGSAQNQRWDYEGLNAIGTIPDIRVLPNFLDSPCVDSGFATDAYGKCTVKHKHPYTFFFRPSFYPLAQTINPATCADGTTNTTSTCAVKNAIFGRTSNYGSINTAAFPDIYDPEFNSWMSRYIQANQGAWLGAVSPLQLNESDWLMEIMVDQTDDAGCLGSGPDWASNPTGHNHRHCTYALFKTAPHQAASTSPANMIYANANSNMKQKVASYLCCGAGAIYSTIGALNTAWGGGANYDSATTDGTQVSAEALTNSAGNTWVGASTNKLAHTNIDPFSIQVFDGNGQLVAGDTGAGNCISNQSTYASGTLVGTTCTITYTTGAFSITFNNAITGTPTVTYWHDGFTYGKGLWDEDGRNTAWVGATSGSGQFLHGENGVAFTGSAQMATDLDTVTQKILTDYSTTIRTAIKQWLPNTLISFNTYLGNWRTPANKFVYLGICPQADEIGINMGLTRTDPAQAGSVVAAGLTQLQFVGKFCGDIPATLYTIPSSNLTPTNLGDSPFDASTTAATLDVVGQSQQWRGRYIYDECVQAMSQTNSSGHVPFIGVHLWQFEDQWQSASWFNNGYVTARDNLYNGVEDTQNAGTDTNGYVSNLESVDATHTGNYGDLVSYLQACRSFIENTITGTAQGSMSGLSGGSSTSGGVR